MRDFTEKLSEIIFSGDLLKMTYRVFLDVLVGKRTILNATLKAATNMFKGTFHVSKISPVLKYVLWTVYFKTFSLLSGVR